MRRTILVSICIALALSLGLSLVGQAKAEPIVTYYFEASLPYSYSNEFAPFSNTTLTGTFSYDKASVLGINGGWGVEGTIIMGTLSIEFSNGNTVTTTRNWYVNHSTDDLWLLRTRGEASVTNNVIYGYYAEGTNAFVGPNSNIPFGSLRFMIPKTTGTKP